MEQNQTVIVNGQELKLKITLGFWKHCGFKREEAAIIEQDQDLYFKALKLAVFYGNRETFNWNSFDDMSKNFTDDAFEACEQDYSQDISMAMIWYMPKKLRDITLKKIKDLEAKHEELIENALNAMDETVQEEKPSEDSKKK